MINAFLANRKEAARVGGTFSDWKSQKGDTLVEIKLGVILFSIMINNLISDWHLFHLRTKFVDDTAALKFFPRNSISYLNNTVYKLHQFSIKGKWQYKFLFSHFEELWKLLNNFSFRFFISCLVLEIFSLEVMRCPPSWIHFSSH
jgi:hypothetical protein